tara:strand:+ start:520 stop:1458 length:939 start_codon:yes stop_codon:yes gene_type:complete
MLNANPVRNKTTAQQILTYVNPRKRDWLPEPQYKEINSKKAAWVKAATEECQLTHNEAATLSAITFNTDIDGKGSPCIATVVRKSGLSYPTVSRHLTKFVTMGILGKESGPRRNIKRGKTPPKLYTLVGFKYELSDEQVNMIDNLNSYQDSNNTYMPNDVCHSADNHEEPDKPMPKRERRPFKTSKHIDTDKLNTPSEAEAEIARAVKSYGLDESLIQYVVAYLNAAKGIGDKGAYLGYMLGKLSSGTWNKKSLGAREVKPVDTGRQRALDADREREAYHRYLAANERARDEAEMPGPESAYAKLKKSLRCN